MSLYLPINAFASQNEASSGWTRIGKSRSSGIERSERQKEQKKPWMNHTKSRDQVISEAIQRQKTLYECQKIEKKTSEPEVKKKEAQEGEESSMYRKLSEWTKIGPGKPTIPDMPKRPKREIKEKEPLTISQRLETLDLDEGLSEVFEDKRFTDISQRINKRKGWK